MPGDNSEGKQLLARANNYLLEAVSVTTHQNFIASGAVQHSALVAETYRHTNLSALIVHLFHLNFGTNLHSLAVWLPASPPLAVVSNNLGVYKRTSIIPTTVLGVILKPPPPLVCGWL